ncbi:MAG: carboxypeptidase-like regulatory domain-containing protein [Pyrinomonadaceae bacterium]
MRNTINSVGIFLVLMVLLGSTLFGQETRGSIFGVVTDSSGSVVAGADVTVTNVSTNVANRVQTNDSGYYEALLLLPGDYEVSAETAGFKKIVRKGINLSVGGRARTDLLLEIGEVSETVTVTADTPLIETSAVTAGRIIDNRSVRDLPTLNNNTTLLTIFTPGVQVGNVFGYTNPAFTFLGDSVGLGSKVGGNDFSIDGVQSRADRRRVAFQPHPDTVAEFRVETANFDASSGASSGLRVSTQTKSGTNEFHGSASWQHWRSSWNAVPYFVKKNFNERRARELASGDPNRIELENRLELVPNQSSNNYAFAIGGPIYLPRFGDDGGPALWSGKKKLFFFFNYNGLKDRMYRPAYGVNSVPTEAHRRGDFSDLLQFGPEYQIYDPLTARPDPNRAGHVIRDPFPGNIIPQNRFNNPMYQAYISLLPLPNVVRTNPRENYSSNYINLVPWTFDYHTWSTRVDYNLSDKQKIFGRVLYSKNLEHNQDWLANHAPGWGEAIGLRENIGGTLDWVWTATSNTVVNFSASIHNFAESNEPVDIQMVAPSSLGFPSYLDEYAEGRGKQHFPQFNVSGYSTVATWGAIAHPPGVPKNYEYRSFKGDMTHIRGNHTLRGGLDTRFSYKTLTEPGNTSGRFSFSNVWTRRDSSGITPASSLGLSWAAFILGMPSNGMNVSFNDDAAAYNPFYGGYVQDNWRFSPRLTLNIGLRLEYDVGATERFDRLIGELDKDAELPITSLAQTSYANVLAGLTPAQRSLLLPTAASFQVRGGSVYPGKDGASRKLYGDQLLWMPRFGASYMLDENTVLQGGYGIYHDILNVMDFSSNFPLDSQLGYSVGTFTDISLDNGLTWLVGDPQNGISPLTDPFPVRADGTRFDSPVRDALGLSAIQGGGYSYIPYDIKRARQQRWRASIQRQIGNNMVLEAAYAGSYSDDDYFNRNINVLPGSFWVTDDIRRNDHLTELLRTVPNPFRYTRPEFASLQQTHPLVYQDMQNTNFFRSSTISVSQLISPFPQLGTLTERTNEGKHRHHALELSLRKRFSKGLSFDIGYTMTSSNVTSYLNSVDDGMSWVTNNGTRPHRITGSGIYELPFGRNKPFLNDGFLSKILGGWQIAATYTWQQGALIGFGNQFYYGDMETLAKDIKPDKQTLEHWFNWQLFPGNGSDYLASNRTAYEARIREIVPQSVLDRMTTAGICRSGANAVPCTYSNVTPSNFQPNSLQRRVFPQFIAGLRAPGINYTNANLQRNFRFTESMQLQLRLDVLNLFNNQSYGGPNGNGVITADANGPSRFLQIQGRFRF